MAQLDDDLSGPATRTGEAFHISALQLEDITCITLLEWIRADVSPPPLLDDAVYVCEQPEGQLE